jgi:hypothetical protein
VDLVVIGRLARWTLASAQSDYEPAYRVELDVDDDTASALRALCDSGPLGDADGAHYPIVGRTAVFSTKLRSLQRNDALQIRLDAKDPFLYLFHGSDLKFPHGPFPPRSSLLPVWWPSKLTSHDPSERPILGPHGLLDVAEGNLRCHDHQHGPHFPVPSL